MFSSFLHCGYITIDPYDVFPSLHVEFSARKMFSLSHCVATFTFGTVTSIEPYVGP